MGITNVNIEIIKMSTVYSIVLSMDMEDPDASFIF